jgi:HEPN domain-containing protein
LARCSTRLCEREGLSITDPDVLAEVDRWLQYARDDLRAAEVLREHGGVPRTACFHAQQAAEKAIEGASIFLRVGFRKTHDLELLAGLLPEDWQLAQDPAALSGLSDWAVGPRYPDDVVEATEEDSQIAIEEARRAYEMALEDMERHGYAPVGRRTGENAEGTD